MIRFCLSMLVLLLCGCFLHGERIEIVDGVVWESLGGNASRVTVEANKYSISGDLHVEFLDYGILVSKWDASSAIHQYVYIDLKDKEHILMGGLSKQVLNMRRKKKYYRSYCLSCLIGGTDGDKERQSFAHEKKELFERLNQSTQNALTNNFPVGELAMLNSFATKVLSYVDSQSSSWTNGYVKVLPFDMAKRTINCLSSIQRSFTTNDVVHVIGKPDVQRCRSNKAPHEENGYLIRYVIRKKDERVVNCNDETLSFYFGKDGLLKEIGFSKGTMLLRCRLCEGKQ